MDLQLPNNNILSHFTFDNTQPSLTSISNVVFPPYTNVLLDGLAMKRELPGGDEVTLYASWPIDLQSNAVPRPNLLFWNPR